MKSPLKINISHAELTGIVALMLPYILVCKKINNISIKIGIYIYQLDKIYTQRYNIKNQKYGLFTQKRYKF